MSLKKKKTRKKFKLNNHYMDRQEGEPAQFIGFFSQMNPQLPEKIQGNLWNWSVASDTKLNSSRSLWGRRR